MKTKSTARNSGYILAGCNLTKLAYVALENTRGVAGASQWVKGQQIVGTSVV